MLPIEIHNGTGDRGNKATVTEHGQLVTSPVKYDQSVVSTFESANTAYNLVVPEPDSEIVITGLTAYANKNVSATSEATVEIYEATGVDVLTVSRALVTIPLLKQQNVTLLPLNLQVPRNTWINGKTDDDDIIVSMFYYYLTHGG